MFNFKNLICIILLFSALACLAQKEAISYPAQIDIGKVEAGKKISASINLKNNSDKEIILYRIAGGICSCVLSFPSKAVLPPNSEYKLPFVFAPDKNSHGKLELSPVALTTEKEQPQLNFKIKVYVENNSLESDNKQVNSKKNKDTIPVICFLIKGCSDCKRIEDFLKALKVAYPNIQYKNYYASNKKELNYILNKSKKMNIPKERLLDAPTIFIGKKYIINQDITLIKLIKMIESYNRKK